MSQLYVQTSSGGGGGSNIQTITGTTGGAVGPTANNITLTASGNLTVTGNPGTSTLTISESLGGQIIAVTGLANTDSPYTVLTTDYFLACNSTAGAIVLNFPNAPTKGSSWVIKDSLGTAGTNNVTCTTPGGVKTFDGATSKVINTNFDSIQIVYDGSNYEIF